MLGFRVNSKRERLVRPILDFLATKRSGEAFKPQEWLIWKNFIKSCQ